jgi:hypothetical protein
VLLWNLIQISELNLILFLCLGFRTYLNFPAESSVQLAIELNSNFLLPLTQLVQDLIQTTIYRLKAGNAGSLQKVVINQHLAVFAPLRAVINERTS